jgi:hypothetical protein
MSRIVIVILIYHHYEPVDVEVLILSVSSVHIQFRHLFIGSKYLQTGNSSMTV